MSDPAEDRSVRGNTIKPHSVEAENVKANSVNTDELSSTIHFPDPNDSAAVQAAIDEAHTNNGGVVYLKTGNYSWSSSSSLQIPPGVSLVGPGVMAPEHGAVGAKIDTSGMPDPAVYHAGHEVRGIMFDGDAGNAAEAVALEAHTYDKTGNTNTPDESNSEVLKCAFTGYDGQTVPIRYWDCGVSNLYFKACQYGVSLGRDTANKPSNNHIEHIHHKRSNPADASWLDSNPESGNGLEDEVDGTVAVDIRWADGFTVNHIAPDDSIALRVLTDGSNSVVNGAWTDSPNVEQAKIGLVMADSAGNTFKNDDIWMRNIRIYGGKCEKGILKREGQALFVRDSKISPQDTGVSTTGIEVRNRRVYLDNVVISADTAINPNGGSVVRNGVAHNPQTLNLGGSNGTVSPSVLPYTDRVYAEIDAGGSACNLTGIDGTATQPGQMVTLKRTGGETVTLEHLSGATNKLIMNGRANKDLDSFGETVTFVYQGSDWREMAYNTA